MIHWLPREALDRMTREHPVFAMTFVIAGAVLFAVGVGLLLLGCGASWQDADATAVRDASRDVAAGLDLCAPDAGACNAGQVRALDRAAFCTLAATLTRHGLAVPDAGLTCEAR